MMKTKTYRAGTMKEALAQVRRDLGGDAVILETREVRRRRLMGLGTRELIEVTASDGQNARGPAPSRPSWPWPSPSPCPSPGPSFATLGMARTMSTSTPEA